MEEKQFTAREVFKALGEGAQLMAMAFAEVLRNDVDAEDLSDIMTAATDKFTAALLAAVNDLTQEPN